VARRYAAKIAAKAPMMGIVRALPLLGGPTRPCRTDRLTVSCRADMSMSSHSMASASPGLSPAKADKA